MVHHLSTFEFELLDRNLSNRTLLVADLSKLELAEWKTLCWSRLFWLTRGSSSETRVPLPGWLSATRIPPSSFASRHAVASPRPLPRPDSLVVKKGSQARPKVLL